MPDGLDELLDQIEPAKDSGGGLDDLISEVGGDSPASAKEIRIPRATPAPLDHETRLSVLSKLSAFSGQDLVPDRAEFEQPAMGTVGGLAGSPEMFAPSADNVDVGFSPAVEKRFKTVLPGVENMDQAQEIIDRIDILNANGRLAHLRELAAQDAARGEVSSEFTAPNGRYNTLVNPEDPESQAFQITDAEQAREFMRDLDENRNRVLSSMAPGTLTTLAGMFTDGLSFGLALDDRDRQTMALGVERLKAHYGELGGEILSQGAALAGAAIPISRLGGALARGMRAAGVPQAVVSRTVTPLALSLYSTPSAIKEGEPGHIATSAAFGVLAPAIARRVEAGLARAPARLRFGMAESIGFALAGQAINPDGTWNQAAANAVLGGIMGATGKKATAFTRGKKIERLITEVEREIANVTKGLKNPKRAVEIETKDVSPEVQKVGEAGFVDPSIVYSGVEALAKGVGTVGRNTFASLIHRVRGLGSKDAKQAALLAERAVDTQKEIRGEMADNLEAALRASGAPQRGGTPGRGKAVRDMSRPRPVSKDAEWSRSNLYEMIEGTNERVRRPEPSNPAEAEVIGSLRRLIDQRGQIFEREGMLQVDATDGTVVPFQNIPGGRVAPRVMSPEFYDIIDRGTSHHLYERTVRSFSQASGVKQETIRKRFTELRDALNGEGPQASERAAHAEFGRLLESIPHFIRDGSGRSKRWIPMVETNPFRYATRLVELGSARVGFIRHYGQSMGPKAKVARSGDVDTDVGLEALEAKLREPTVGDRLEAGLKKAHGRQGRRFFTEMTRAIHGLQPTRPLESVGPIDIGSKVTNSRTMRGIQHSLGILRSAMLTASSVVNVPEPLGNIRDFAGNRGLARAVARTMGSLKTPHASQQNVIHQLEMMGAITRDIMNLSVDPNHPGETANRWVREISSRISAHKYVNEFQERLAGVAALDAVGRMKTGGDKRRNVMRLRAMGFGRAKSEKLANGRGTEAEYDAVVRRAVGQMVGSTFSKAEMSRWEADRVIQHSIAFQRYAHTVFRDTMRKTGTFVQTLREIRSRTDIPKRERWLRAGAAARQMLGHVAGKAAQGTGAYLLMSYLTGGSQGFDIALNEFADDPAEFLTESAVFSMFAGPFGAVIRTMNSDATLADAVFPVFVAGELSEAFGGDGAYRDLGFVDRMDRLSRRFIPGRKLFDSGLVAVGLGSDEARDIHTAVRAYWRYRFDEENLSRGKQREISDEMREFRLHMKRAHTLMKDHADPEDVQEAIDRAMGVEGKGKKEVKTSLLGRRLLPKLDDDRREALRSRIGNDAYRALEVHDRMLERYAKGR